LRMGARASGSCLRRPATWRPRGLSGVTVTAFRGRAFVSNENRHWVRALLERRGEGRVELVIPPGRVALAVGQAVYIL